MELKNKKMDSHYHSHPIRLVVMACCTALLGFTLSPWFFILTLVFSAAWAVGFLKWVLG